MKDLIKDIAGDLNWNKWMAANSTETAVLANGSRTTAKQGCTSGHWPPESTGRAD
jgi:hypothetical protein